MSTDWSVRERDYGAESSVHSRSGRATLVHPLQSATEAKKAAELEGTVQKLKRKQDADAAAAAAAAAAANADAANAAAAATAAADLDPLSAMLAKANSAGSTPLNDPLSGGIMDPLSAAAAMGGAGSSIGGTGSSASGPTSGLSGRLSLAHDVDMVADDGETFEPWVARRGAILQKYTTSEKLSIVTSFLTVGDKTMLKAQSALTDKVRHRVEQLDDFEGTDQEKLDELSQQDYMNRIEELNQELIKAWDADQRVKSLKIAIQCAKLLADTAVIRFYPSKFVLITDILDTFGRLVYDRIRLKSSYFKPGAVKPVVLPEDFTPSMVPDSAKETCRNWFFKIASIRELIPRLYVETAILKCYSFLTTDEYTHALGRLSKMIRGIGDPLVCVYARAYLCRVGWTVAPNVRGYLAGNLSDFFFAFKQVQSSAVARILQEQNVDLGSYLNLYAPAVEWLLNCIAYRAPEATLEKILKQYNDQCKSAVVLNAILTAFRPTYVSSQATIFTELIRTADCTGFAIHDLYRTLGTNLVLSDPPEKLRLTILNEVWKVVMKLTDPIPYMSCAEVWIEYPVKHFGAAQINAFLGDVIKHVTVDRAFESFYPQLQSIVNKVLSHITDFGMLFSMDKFMPFIDLFQKASIKVDVCKAVMEAFVKRQLVPTADPVILNALVYVGKVLHDAIDALSFDDERRQTSNLICGFLRKVSFGRDLEQQLNFYVEARANFTNLDTVLIHLTQCANTLVMRAQTIVKGRHTKKTAAFARACIAYSFITIPSIVDVVSRLNLYLLAGQVALANQALPQADAFFRAAVTLIPDIPKTTEIDLKQRSTEPILVSFLLEFLSTLLVVPDHPDHGKLYMVKGLINMIQTYQWEENGDGKIRVYMGILSLMASMHQTHYAYRIEGVESNDTLYGGETSFLEEINKVVVAVNEEILTHLASLQDNANAEAHKRQADLALQLFNLVISLSDLSSAKNASLAVNLWNLTKRNNAFDVALMKRSANYLKTLAGEVDEAKRAAYEGVVARLK
ncbi:hypothetical protein CAOG_005411 [Capsaspora owczarzaki ATCC 30864]|uniref:Uncharacterized protein n=1 Tax=Capsaspora owczarzaki (strain ATCC 30864) TaxID=595528 RepID=A0A0D2WRZ1_CAPO3|nr:hypothetical protein CAOG_005411 [Capsaspora owczarzaki ATCC 30864]